MLVGPVLLFAALYTNGKHILHIGDESVFSYYIYSCSQDGNGVNYRINTALHHYLCLKDYIYLTRENHSPRMSQYLPTSITLRAKVTVEGIWICIVRGIHIALLAVDSRN